MLDPRLLHVRPLEPPQEMGIPELRADAEVLAAAHQGVGLAPLDRGGQLVGREVGVFPLGLRDEPVGWVSAKLFLFYFSSLFSPRKRRVFHVPAVDDERILPRDDGVADHGVALGDHAPAHGAKGLVQPPPVLDLGEVDDAVGLDLDVLDGERRHEGPELLLRYRAGGYAVEAVGPVYRRYARGVDGRLRPFSSVGDGPGLIYHVRLGRGGAGAGAGAGAAGGFGRRLGLGPF